MADYSDVHDMITAVTFSPDGRKAVVGTMKGKCRFYTCEQDFKLEYEAQIGMWVWWKGCGMFGVLVGSGRGSVDVVVDNDGGV